MLARVVVLIGLWGGSLHGGTGTIDPSASTAPMPENEPEPESILDEEGVADTRRLYDETVTVDQIPRAMEPGAWEGSNWIERADYAKDWLFLKFQNSVSAFDRWFVREGEEALPIPVSQFRISPAMRFEQDEDFRVGIDFDFDTDINLPNIKDRLKLVISNRDIGELPGTDRVDQEGGVRAGLSREFLDNLRFDVGIEFKLPPGAYTEAEWSRPVIKGEMTYWPSAKVYYRTIREGLGFNANFLIQRWWGKSFLRNTTGFKWNEDLDDPEYANNIVFGRALELLDSAKFRRVVRGDDIARGYGCRYRFLGDLREDSAPITEHRVTLFYKWPVRKRYLFAYVAPEYRWREETDYEGEALFTMGFDILFWGYEWDKQYENWGGPF